MVYASSSSTYGDEASLPKIESRIGTPLSPYAVTKRISEMYSTVFSSLHGMELIGLRYFNIFGPRQDPEGMYAAVIPKFTSMILNQEIPKSTVMESKQGILPTSPMLLMQISMPCLRRIRRHSAKYSILLVEIEFQ